MKRNLITFGVAAAIVGTMFGANAYLSVDRKVMAAKEEAQKAAEAVEKAKQEEEKAKAEAAQAEQQQLAANEADKTPPPAPAAPTAPAAPAAPAEPAAEWPSVTPDVFKVKFETTAGDFVVECHKDWAPIGVERFYQLCKEGYFDNSAFFRVVPGFVVQFGLAADPNVSAQWKEQNLQDEPVKQSNGPGYLTFAKSSAPNSRTTQLFINLGNNANLDGMGFSAFGKVIEGMENVKKIESKYGERPRQDLITSQGDEYISKFFPDITKIKKTTLLK